MTSIHDVARHTGVSTATVSRALRGLPNVSPKTRQAVQAAAAELGYVPSPSAAGLSSGRHRAIGVGVPGVGVDRCSRAECVVRERVHRVEQQHGAAMRDDRLDRLLDEFLGG